MTKPAFPKYRASAIDWLGGIPEHWEVKKFRHLFSESSETNGPSPIGEMLSVSGYRGVEIKRYDDENSKRLDADLETYRVVRPGQLAVNTMWLNYAGLGVSELTGYVSPAYRSYWINSRMHRRFAHHLMRSGIYVDAYTGHLTGIRPNSLQMSRNTLMGWPVLVPPLDEQRQIAEYLDRETRKIDELITKQELLILVLHERWLSLITRSITKGIGVNATLRRSGIDWIGMIPAQWAVRKVKSFGRMQTGGTPSTEVAAYFDEDSGTPWVRPQDIDKMTFATRASMFLTKEGLVNASPVVAYSTLVCCIGAGSIGKIGYTEVQCTTNQQITAIEATEGGRFLAYALQAANDQILSMAATNRLPIINNSRLGDIALPCPPVDEQRAISKFLDEASERSLALRSKTQAFIGVLRERRAALISAAVTGKIDVRGL